MKIKRIHRLGAFCNSYFGIISPAQITEIEAFPVFDQGHFLNRFVKGFGFPYRSNFDHFDPFPIVKDAFHHIKLALVADQIMGLEWVALAPN